MRTQRQPTTPFPTDSIAKSLGFLELQKAEEGAAAKPVFRITSEVLDRSKDRVMAAGAKVENYGRNPVLLWNHDYWNPAIGTAKVYQDAAGQWLMEPSFDGIGEASKEIAAKVAAGTLRTCSIRFRILKYAYNEEGGLDIEEWELLEVSIVNIPCNPEAERVKNANPNPQQQKNSPTPPEAEPAKALEDADMEAIKAAIAEQVQPVAEKMDSLEKALGQMKALYEKMMAEEETPAEAPAAEPEKSLASRFIR